MVWNEENIRKVLTNAMELPESSLGSVPHTKLVYRMLQQMYQRQTADEQVSQYTKHRNSIGFNGIDGEILSDIAAKSQRYQNLTPKQTSLVAKRLRKYSRQLAEIAAVNEAARNQVPNAA